MVLHSTLGGANLHDPKGISPTPLTLEAAIADAYRIDDESANPVFVIDTSADEINIGHNTAIVTIHNKINNSNATAFRCSTGTSDYIIIATDTPRINLGGPNNDAIVAIEGEGALRVSSLTTAERDAITAENGMIVWNETTAQFEGYTGTWGALGGGLPHSVTGDDQVIIEDSVNSRAALTVDVVIDGTERLEVGNDTDGYNLRIIQLATAPRALQFGTEAGADQAIVVGMNHTYPANLGDNNIMIGNSVNLQASGNITVVGDVSRADGIQATLIGAGGRAQQSDTIIGYDSESTNVTGLNAGVGEGLRFTGNNNSALGRSILDNGGNNNVYLGAGCRGSASATSTMFVGGQTAAQAVRTYIFGRGGDVDDTNTTVLEFRASAKSGNDLSGIYRLNAGDSTGNVGTTLEFYGAESGLTSGPTARVASRLAHISRTTTGANLHLGNAGTNTDMDSNLFFNGGTGAASRQMRLWYDGSADTLFGSMDGGVAFLKVATGQLLVGIGGNTNSNSAVFGHSSDCFGTNGVLMGNDSALASGNSNGILVGYQSSLSGTADFSVLIGSSAGSGNNGASSIAMGYDVVMGHDECFVVGREAASTAANQAVFGSQNYNYTLFALGQGVEGNFSPANIVIRGTNGITGSNLIGGEMAIASGVGTGNGNSGGLKLQVPGDNPASTTQQTLRNFIFLNPNIGEQSSQSYETGRIEYNVTPDGDANATKYNGQHTLTGTGTQSWSIPYTIPDDSAGMMVIFATAYDTTANEVAMYGKAVRFRRAGATLNVVVTDIFADSEEGTASDWNFTCVAGGGGTTIQVNATGDTTNTTRWAFDWSLQNVS